MLGGQGRVQRTQQAATPHHALQRMEGVFPMQLQTQVGRQHKPLGDFLLLASRRHRVGQRLEQLLLETQLEERLLIGLAENLQTVEVPLPEGFQHPAGMRFNQFEVHPQTGAAANAAVGDRPTGR